MSYLFIFNARHLSFFFLYLYISKSWSVAFIVAMLQLSYISIHVIIIFLFNFPITFFNIYSFFKYLHFFQLFSIPYLFISPLPFTFISLFIFPFILFFFFFCLFLFTLSYYKFVTLFHSLHTFPSPKKKKKGSLSFSIFLVDFYFLFFLHLCFRLINFCVL